METIEGLRPVLEALKSERDINKILVAREMRGKQMEKVRYLASQQNIPILTVDRKKLNAISNYRNNQGIIALAAPKSYVPLENVLNDIERGIREPLLVLLEGVTDPQNFGAILRVAEAVGCSGVIIGKHRSVPLTAAVAKASAGAVEHIPVVRVTNLAQSMKILKERGFWIAGMDPEAVNSVYSYDLTGPLAIVLGSEGKGMGPKVASYCDFTVRLPMLGKTASLNVASAAAAVLYEAVRQRKKQQKE